MSTGKLQRFDMGHLRDFRGPIVAKTMAAAPAEVEAPPPPPPPPTFKEADLDHARDAGKKLGYAEGFEAGLAQAATETATREKDLAAAMTRISEHVVRLAATYRKLVEEQSKELAELVIGISRKVAGEALDQFGTAAIEGVVERCLPLVFGKPRIAIDLSPKVMYDIEPRLRKILEESGYSGNVEFRSNDALEGYDIRVDWVQGQANRSTKTLWQEIEALLQQVPLTPNVPVIREIKVPPIG